MRRVDDFSRRGNVFDKIAEAWGNSKREGWRRGGLERSSASGMSDTDDETVGGEGQWAVG